MCLKGLFGKKSGVEQPSPGNWVKREQIEYDAGLKRLCIDLEPNIRIFDIADTNSMDGLLDIGHNVIATDNFDFSKLIVGDIVVYQIYTTLIVHRIVEIKEDNAGRVYRCKGDNNATIDPYYIRDVNIRFLVLAVIY